MKTINILGVEFKIIYMNLESEGLFGDCNVGTRTIRIGSNHPPETQHSTLWHECIHAAIGVAGLNNLLTTELEEALVICLEHAFNDHVDLMK